MTNSFVDINGLIEMVDEKLLTMQKHPNHNLLIWNYTQKCQFNKENWNDITMMCRGLITTPDGTVVSRPFKKFFNMSEHIEESSKLEEIDWNLGFEVTKKMDGSLGISYKTDDGWSIATRGSFTSDQAQKGTAILKELNEETLDENYTYLFEIIYPTNRIVVNYGDQEKLVLLAIVNTKTGEELERELVETAADKLGCECVKSIKLEPHQVLSYTEDYEHESNDEGIVVRFDDGLRVKVKLLEYVRLHKILTGINKRHIWERLMHDRGFDDVLEVVPDEFMQWVRQTIHDLSLAFDMVKTASEELFDTAKMELGPNAGRKDFAMKFTDKNHVKYSAILFKMLDGKPYDKTIWRMLKPEATEPFHQDIDG